MDFPKPETPVSADRLVTRSLRLARKIRTLGTEPQAQALALSAPLGDAGIATAWIATRERSLQLSPTDLDHYLAEIGASETIGRQWKQSGQTAWRETYVKLAKTIVRVGPESDPSWSEPVGLPLEIVPENDPTALAQGDSFGLRLLWQGRPLPDLAIGAAPASPAKPILTRTDADGRAAVRLDHSGPWLFRATLIQPSKKRKGEWDSVFTTLTLVVTAP